MKTVYLLRHAKSDISDFSSDDSDRPLNRQGQIDAVRIGQYLSDQKIQPDIILCSSAARAQETLSFLGPFLPDSTTIQIEETLYLASSETLLQHIENSDDAADSSSSWAGSLSELFRSKAATLSCRRVAISESVVAPSVTRAAALSPSVETFPSSSMAPFVIPVVDGFSEAHEELCKEFGEHDIPQDRLDEFDEAYSLTIPVRLAREGMMHKATRSLANATKFQMEGMKKDLDNVTPEQRDKAAEMMGKED